MTGAALILCEILLVAVNYPATAVSSDLALIYSTGNMLPAMGAFIAIATVISVVILFVAMRKLPRAASGTHGASLLLSAAPTVALTLFLISLVYVLDQVPVGFALLALEDVTFASGPARGANLIFDPISVSLFLLAVVLAVLVLSFVRRRRAGKSTRPVRPASTRERNPR